MTHAARTVPGTENINGFLVRSLPRVSVAALATPACVPDTRTTSATAGLSGRLRVRARREASVRLIFPNTSHLLQSAVAVFGPKIVRESSFSPVWRGALGGNKGAF